MNGTGNVPGPCLNRKNTGHKNAHDTASILYYFEQVGAVDGIHLSNAPVIKNQQIDTTKIPNLSFETTIHLVLSTEFLQEARHPNETYGKALSASGVSNCSGDECFSTTGLTGDDAILMVADLVAIAQSHNLRLVQTARSVKVNISQAGVLMANVSFSESTLEGIFLTPIHFGSQ